jgi:hypothetical protein
MTTLINASTSSGLVQTADTSGIIKVQSNGVTTNAIAWVNFNGTSSTPITPRSAYNVGSVTKNGTGDYTVNFTNALSDANYSVSICQNSATVANDSAVSSFGILLTGSLGTAATTKSTTALRILARYILTSGTGVFDVNECNVAVFGN